jgi:hypothetical protein
MTTKKTATRTTLDVLGSWLAEFGLGYYDGKLPTEYPFRKAFNIYRKRLRIFSIVVALNLILLGLVLLAVKSPLLSALALVFFALAGKGLMSFHDRSVRAKEIRMRQLQNQCSRLMRKLQASRSTQVERFPPPRPHGMDFAQDEEEVGVGSHHGGGQDPRVW